MKRSYHFLVTKRGMGGRFNISNKGGGFKRKLMGIDNNEKSRKTAQNGQPQKSKMRIIAVSVAVVAVIVIVALSVTIVLLLNRETKQQEQAVKSKDYVSGAKGTVVTEDNLDEVLDKLRNPGKDASYEVTMNREWVFETAGTPSKNAYVENKDTNSRTVFFEVILRDTEELVYTSPYLPLGSTLRDFALDVELAAGEYNAKVIFYLVDDDYKEITDVTVGTKIVIEG